MSVRNRLFALCMGMAPFVWAQGNSSFVPVWWAKYQHLLSSGAENGTGPSNSVIAGGNVNVSNECGPQSETFIAIDSLQPLTLAAGSNEIFRLPMRGYSTADGGSTWGGVDLPLPAPIGANGTRFGSDPSLAFDTQRNVFYSYIVVFFSDGNGIKGTELAVARSADGGKTYPFVNYFSFSGGSNHFNDKPMITTDTNLTSPFQDNIYVAWDAASGGSTSGGLRFARSADHGATFMTTRIDNPSGPGRVIAADPFVGPNGEVYAAWNDIAANTIAFNRSLDGGVTWGTPGVVASKSIPFDIGIPAISFRRALIYPACDADRSRGAHRGRLYCSWVDLTANGTTDVFASFSDNSGATWSKPKTVAERLNTPVDRFYQWLSVDPGTGQVNISFYDTRNDTTGQRFMTDVYFTQSTDGLSWLAPNVRVSTASSNEHDCNELFPCVAIDYGNQYGDYEGLVSFDGISRAIWTDSRDQQNFASGSACRTNLAMEEVFTATVQ
jgi:hypothetical protein